MLLLLQLFGGMLMFAAGVVLLARLARGPQSPSGARPTTQGGGARGADPVGGLTGVVPAVLSAVVRRGLRIAQWPGRMPTRRHIRRRSFDEEFARLSDQLRKND